DDRDGEHLRPLQVVFAGGLQIAVNRWRTSDVVLDGHVLDRRAQVGDTLLDVAFVALERNQRKRRVSIRTDQQRVAAAVESLDVADAGDARQVVRTAGDLSLEGWFV